MKTRNPATPETCEQNAQKLANAVFEMIENPSHWRFTTVDPEGPLYLEFTSSLNFLLPRVFQYLLSSDEHGQIFNLEDFFFQDIFVENNHWMNIWRKRSKAIHFF
jgi:hypothetical protein